MEDNHISEINLMMKSLDRLFAINNTLKTLVDISGFEEYLKEYYGTGLDDEIIFNGYKFALDTLVRILVSIIERDSTLGFNEDETFFRASFAGVPINDIPNTCEKTIVIKNIWELSRKARKAETLEELRIGIGYLARITELIDRIYEESSTTVPGLDKDAALKILSIFYINEFLIYTWGNIPAGYFLSGILKPTATQEYFKEICPGYIMSLQFILHRLLGKQQFGKCPLKLVPEAIDLCGRESTEQAGNSGYSVESYGFEDYYFCVQRTIIESLMDRLNLKDVYLDLYPLFKTRDTSRDALRELLSRDNISEPGYMKKQSKEDIMKWLDYKLLWYPVEVLSSTGAIFSGVPAFKMILLGLAASTEDTILVKVFKHPDVYGYNYSYGILIPATSQMADYSGWLIFYDCATDYSGFGGSLHGMAQSVINGLRHRLQVDEIEVDIEVFRDYIKERSVSSVFDKIQLASGEEIDLTALKREVESYIPTVRGILLELLVYKWLVENNPLNCSKVEHGITISHEEMDLICFSDETVGLFEVTIALHKDRSSEKIRQIKRKLETLKNKYPDKHVTPYLVTYSRLRQEVKRELEEAGINIIEEFKEKLMRDLKLHRPYRGLIIKILENMKTPY
ncbi:MAG: hypothetical protein GSR82_04445 [Desulfurococcales archaeon]|nr:hypothetical protein [Desulfurococcales archaeon]